MKSLHHLHAISLGIAGIFLPQLDAWLDALRWAQTNITSWMCSRRVSPGACRTG